MKRYNIKLKQYPVVPCDDGIWVYYDDAIEEILKRRDQIAAQGIDLEQKSAMIDRLQVQIREARDRETAERDAYVEACQRIGELEAALAERGAQDMRAHFDSHRPLPSGAGYDVLEMARKFAEESETDD